MNLLERLDPGGPVVRLVLGALLQTTAVILLAALVAGTVLRRRAAARHNLWLGALVWLLISPVVAALADRGGPALGVVIVPYPNLEPVRTSAETPRPSQADPAVDQPGRGRATPEDRADNPPAEASSRVDVVSISGLPAPPTKVSTAAESVVHHRGSRLMGGLFLLWGIGLLLGLGRIAAGLWQVRALTRSAQELDPLRYGATLELVRAAFDQVALPPIVTSTAVTGPIALGLLRPCVVLPPDLAATIPVDALRDVLVHESAHAFRRDPWVGLLQRLTASLFWPYPLVHYLNSQLDRAREEVCDNHVLRCSNACSYARALLALTEQYRPFRMPHAGLGLLGARWTLVDRVAGLLDPGRVQVTRTAVATRIALATALAVTGMAAASVRFAPAAPAALSATPNAGAVAVVSEEAPPTPRRAGVWWLDGIVVDEQGRPVAGAVVRPPPSANIPGLRGGTTAADGTFSLSLGGRRRYLYGLVATSGDGTRVGLSGKGVPLTHLTRQPVRIVLKSTRPLTVRVKNRVGAPIAGAAVEAVEYGYQTQGTTGPDGTATLRVAADAQIHWVVGQKTGAGIDYFENYQPARPNEFPPLPRELSLTLDGALPLRIKAVDSAGHPVPGVQMSPAVLQRTGKAEALTAAFATTSWVTTDAKGVAVFDRFPKDVGGCGFDVRSEKYLCPRPPNSERDGPTELTVRLLRRTRLSGTVRLPDGRPAPNVIVRLEGTLPHDSGIDSLARTGVDGTYALEVRPESVYIVGIEDETWAAPSRTGILVNEDQPQTGLDFTLSRGTLVQGQVTEGDDHKPVAGAGLVLVEQGPLLPKEFRLGVRNGRLARQAVADPQGRYRFRVGPGQYTLQTQLAEPLEFAVDLQQAELVRNLTRKATPSVADFTVAVVEKTKAGERSVPQAAVASLIVGGGRLGPKPADGQGRLQLPHRSGSLVYARGDSGKLAGLIPVPETAKVVKVIVSRAARIQGRLVDTNGKPQSKQRVLIQLIFDLSFTESHRYTEILRTDDQGRFSFQGVPAGTKGEVSAAHANDGRRTSRARTVMPFQVDEPDQTEELELVVPPAGAAKAPVHSTSIETNVSGWSLAQSSHARRNGRAQA